MILYEMQAISGFLSASVHKDGCFMKMQSRRDTGKAVESVYPSPAIAWKGPTASSFELRSEIGDFRLASQRLGE